MVKLGTELQNSHLVYNLRFTFSMLKCCSQFGEVNSINLLLISCRFLYKQSDHKVTKVVSITSTVAKYINMLYSLVK